MGNSSMFLQEFETMMGINLVEMLVGEFPTMLANLAVYIFTGLGLYTIAKRRGIHNPWLAWVPFANMWLLGCISDHFQSVARGKVTRRRVALLVTNILITVMALAVLVLCLVMLARMAPFIVEYLENLEDVDALENLDVNDVMPAELISQIAGPAVGMVLLGLLLLPAGVVYLIFYFMSLHDVYKSCEPSNATLYLVLGIFIGICVPIFLMICRNKDGGMPVRVAPQPAYNPYEQNPYQPPYGMPPQPPVEKDPWEE